MFHGWGAAGNLPICGVEGSQLPCTATTSPPTRREPPNLSGMFARRTSQGRRPRTKAVMPVCRRHTETHENGLLTSHGHGTSDEGCLPKPARAGCPGHLHRLS